KTQRTGASERARCSADAQPDWQGILNWSWIDALPRQSRAVRARPVHALSLANLQEQIEFFGEQFVVVVEVEAKQRKRFDGRAAADHHLRTSLRKQVERGELL